MEHTHHGEGDLAVGVVDEDVADPGEGGPNIVAMIAVAQAIARSLASGQASTPVAAMSA